MLRESRVPDGPCAGFTPHGHVPRPRALIRHSCAGRCGAFARRSWCGRITTTAPPLRRARRRRGHGGSQKGGYQGGCCATDGPHGATAVLRRARWGVRAAIALRTRSACAAAATPHGVATMETATLRGGARGGSEAQRSTDASTRQICAGRQGVRVPQSHHETRCADRTPATEAVVAVAAWWWRGGGRGGHGDTGYAYRGAWTLCERVTVGGERDPLHVRPAAESVPATPISNIGVAGTLFARVTVGGERDPLHVRPAAEG